MRCLVLITGLFVSILVSGCATILHGTTQEVSVSSDPSGATVTTGELKTTTPGKLELQRNTSHLLTFTKEGYQTKTARLASVVSGAVMTNLIAGGLIGWGVDASTGGDSRLVPESIQVKLKPIERQSILLMGPPEAEARLNNELHHFDGAGALSLMLKPGSYRLIVSKNGFEPKEEMLQVEAAKPIITRTITLNPVTPAMLRPSAIPQQAIPTGVTEGVNADKKNNQPLLEQHLKTLNELRDKQLITPEQYEKAAQEFSKDVTE